MGTWKSRGGKTQGKASGRRKKMQAREKVEKSRNAVFFPMQARNHLTDERDEKLHAHVARSRFGRQKNQNTSPPEHFWQLRSGKSARRCGAKRI